MKLITYQRGARVSFGAVVGDGIVNFGARMRGRADSVRGLLEAGLLAEARKLAASTAADEPLSGVRYLRPVLWPEKIICVGVNYPERNAEYRDGADAPPYPSLFMRTPGSLVGHLEPIVLPAESTQLDYEGEMAVVIGRRGRRIRPAEALAHVAGVTCVNEGTVRDWLRHGKFNVTQGKNFERSGAIGPWLVTLDETGPIDRLTVQTRVNGELRQDDTTARLLFPVPNLLAYISTFTELAPGDVIVTGTPSGAGGRLDPPRFLVPGDHVDVAVSAVGTLSSAVEDER